MKIFRKLTALMLCLCMMLALASCDQLTEILEKIKGGKDPETVITEFMTKEEWNAAIAEEKFDNVTLSMLVTFKDESQVHLIVCRLDGNKATVDEDGFKYDADAEEVEALRNIYMNTVLAILENFDSFTYDSAAGVFVSNSDIVYDLKVIEYDAKITVSNAKVTVDANKNIAKIDCSMKQEYTDHKGEDGVIELNAIFTFTDYGTTVAGNGGSSDTTALEEAYENSCKYNNSSIYVEATETLNDGTEIPEYMVFRTTETAMHVDSGSHEVYYAIEDGKNYMYVKDVNGWQKYESLNSAPIGALVEMYVGQFEGIFDQMTYDKENNVYYIENVRVPLTESGIFYHYISIEIQNGLIYELTYIVDTYDYSTETPTVAGRGVAVLTFTDYGKTTVELPELGTGGSAQGEMTRAEWDAAFANTAASSNFTVSQSNTRIPLEGESTTSTSVLATTEFASHTTSPTSSSEAYHSIEDGQYYYYYTSGNGWTKNNADPSSCPIGAKVLQQFTDLFCDLYGNLTYDAETGSYVGGNFILTQSGMDFTIHEFKITFENGLISEIYYVSDMYGGSGNGEMTIIGKGASVIVISNYGTTVVELPTDYVDNTAN